MADSDKNIVITPNKGSSTAEPKVSFVGANASGSDEITLNVSFDGVASSLSFEGSSGQLFSITNSLSGTIFSVNDISGIPSIEVYDDGTIRLAEYAGNVYINDGIAWHAGNDGSGSGLDADLLDGQEGSYYVNTTNVSTTTQTTGANSLSTTASRTYAVQFDASDNLVVNVPWVDTNTNTDTLQSIANDTTNADRFITFVNSASGAQTGGSNAGLKYNPSTGALSVTGRVHLQDSNSNIAIGDSTTGAATTTGATNIALGAGALATNTISIGNIAIGQCALYSYDWDDGGTGDPQPLGNIVIGKNAASLLSSFIGVEGGCYGYGNLIIGHNAACAPTSFSRAVVIGHNAGNGVNPSSDVLIGYGANNSSVAVGYEAGATTGAGSTGVAIGFQAKGSGSSISIGFRSQLCSFGSDNIGIGSGTLYNANTGVVFGEGADNIAIGYYAGCSITTGSNNIVMGCWAMRLGTGTGSKNIAIGDRASYNSASGSSNIAIGACAFCSINDVSNGIAIGQNAAKSYVSNLYGDTVGESIIAIGTDSLLNAAGTGGYGSNVISIGRSSFCSATGIVYGLAIGNSALCCSDGASNIGIGNCALKNVTTGYDNLGIGENAGVGITTGAANIVIGGFGNSIGTGFGNIAIGCASMSVGFGTGVGQYNVSIGIRSHYWACTGTEWNTSIGACSGYCNTVGKCNTFLGFRSGLPPSTGFTTGTNNIAIGYGARMSANSVSNEITLGNSSITKLRVPGIGVETGDLAGGWVAVNMTGTPAVLASFNVASVTFSSGDFIINWDTDFSSANYSIAVGHVQNNGNTVGAGTLVSNTAGTTRIGTYLNGGGTNLSYVSVIAFGDQ